MSEALVFLDMDTQVDFMMPTGHLYVPGAEQIVPNVRRLMSFAREHGIPIISAADTHTPDDPSFSIWPPHCVIGTRGHERIPETQAASARVVPNRPGAFKPGSNLIGQTIVEKQDYDVTTNVNFGAILRSLGARSFVVFGVATEYCARTSVLSLRRYGRPVDVVVDAIRAIKEEDGKKAVEEMVAAGARLTTTDEVTSRAVMCG